MVKYIYILLLLLPLSVCCQQTDTLLGNKIPVNTIVYQKPKPFSFITNIPKDVAGFAKKSFQKNNYNNLKLVAGSTLFLWLSDQAITNTLHDKLEDSKIVSTESFSPFINVKIGGKPTNIGKIPRNINTAFYNLGQGSFSMLLAGGFYVMGKIKKDNRALNTASQLAESFIVLGVGTQAMKYFTGRENPSDESVIRGRWQPFPMWQDFQNHKTKYDAFPSGHLATFVNTVTIIGSNYPEKRWIKPVGYSIAGLIALSMINNGVHWASDFPLGITLGHGYGKYITHKARLHMVSM
ncbi:MAG: phosphatase PAP2 family protein [Ferruginibacter sp.]